MQPNGLFVLAVGLCSFAVVVVFAAFMVHRAWKLAKRGLRISKVVIPLAEDLARKSEDLARVSYDVGGSGRQTRRWTGGVLASTPPVHLYMPK